jgi:hypothetical protein
MKKLILIITSVACFLNVNAQGVVTDSVFIMNTTVDTIITAIEEFDELYTGEFDALGGAEASSVWVVMAPNDLKDLDPNYKCFMRLEKDGVTLNSSTETNPPYALYGDDPNAVPIDFFDGAAFDEGDYTLVIAIINGAGGPLVDGTDSIYIPFQVIAGYDPTSVDQPLDKSFEMYPNPSSRNLTVNSGYEISRITVSNMIGQEILRFDDINEQQYSIDLYGLANGVYMISVADKRNHIKVKKFIKR